MDKKLYDAIKTYMKEGKSLDDIVNEVKNIEKESKETKIADKYKNYTGDKTTLINILGKYFIDNGFKPDNVFADDDEFRKHLTRIVDDGLNASVKAMNALEEYERDDNNLRALWKLVDEELRDLIKKLV